MMQSRNTRRALQRLSLRLGGALAVVAAAVLTVTAQTSESRFKLTFDKPATKWTEALPLGNGRIGAMVFGGTQNERLQINESTLWGGGPHDYTNPDAHSRLDKVRQQIFAGKIDEAEKLSENLMGKPKMLMPYQPFCDVRLHFPGHGQATEYHRELKLDDAVAETTYRVGAANFRREAFVSYPDQFVVVRITASQPGELTFSIGLDSPQVGTRVESTPNNILQLTGQSNRGRIRLLHGRAHGTKTECVSTK
jgi:alpha-L-fucosidase 2